MRVKLSLLRENRTKMNLSINAEAVFIRNAHPGTLSKPPGLGEYFYTGFLVDGNKCSQAYDRMICVYAFVCICVCVCVCARTCVCVCVVCISMCLQSFIFEPLKRLSQTRLIRMLCYWSTFYPD
jgi:hypothetical protein